MIGGGPSSTQAPDAERITYTRNSNGTVTSSGWSLTSSMVSTNGRRRCDGVMLPDGSVLVAGGEYFSGGEEHTPNLACEIYDPGSNGWSEVDDLNLPRMYHSVALLLPDGRVVMSGNEGEGSSVGFDGATYELFYPPYLFASGGTSWAVRDTIDTHPASVFYGLPFEISLQDGVADDVDEVALLKAGSVTHSINMSQRRVLLSHATVPGEGGTLLVSGPKDESYAPPGDYLLFVLDGGVPSEGVWVTVERGTYTLTSGQSVRWGADVWLDRDFTVEPGASLEILPGTSVRARSGNTSVSEGVSPLVELAVQGTLLADGASGSEIEFASEGGTGGQGEWYGIRFEVTATARAGYGYVGLDQTPSSVTSAVIRNAEVGIELADVGAPSLADLDLSHLDPDEVRQIHADSTDVVLAAGYFLPDHTWVPSPVQWDLEAPLFVTVAREVRTGLDDPVSRGGAGLVDIIVDGSLHTSRPPMAPGGSYVRFAPVDLVQADSVNAAAWSGLELGGSELASRLEHADVGYAVSPVRTRYAYSATVKSSVVHHYRDHGIHVVGGGSGGGTTIEDCLVLRGAKLGKTEGIWGILAQEASPLVIRDNDVYDFDTSSGSLWVRSTRQDGGGISVQNSKSYCGTGPLTAHEVLIRDNRVVGPGETHTFGPRTGLHLLWACGGNNREVDVRGNAIQQWYRGLDAVQSLDAQVSCNRIQDDWIGTEFWRNSFASGPEVRFGSNLWSSSGARTIHPEDGIEMFALGPQSGTASDRGRNGIQSGLLQVRYITQADPTTNAADSLFAGDNQWQTGSGAPEASRAAVLARCEAEGSADVNRIAPDSPRTTQDYVPACVPGAASTEAPTPGGGGAPLGARAVRERAELEDNRATRQGLSEVRLDRPSRTGFDTLGPNPAGTETAVRFGVAGEVPVPLRIRVFDVRGGLVRTLADGALSPGWHVLRWNGRDHADRRVSSGIYFLRLEGPGVSETRKLVRLH